MADKETEFEKLFVTLEAHTQQFDEAVPRAKAMIEDLVKVSAKPIQLKLEASNLDLRVALNQAKKAIQEAGFDPEHNRPLVAKLDAEISSLEAKIKTSDLLIDRLVNEPHTVSLLANADSMNATLKSAEARAIELTTKVQSHGDALVAAETQQQEKFAAAVDAFTQKRGRVETQAYAEDKQRSDDAAKLLRDEESQRAKLATDREAQIQRRGRLETQAYAEDQHRSADAAKVLLNEENERAKLAAAREAQIQRLGRLEVQAYAEDKRRSDDAAKVVANEESQRVKLAAAREAQIQRLGRLESQAYTDDADRTTKIAASLDRRTRSMALLEIEAHKMNDALDNKNSGGFQSLVEGAQSADLSLGGLARTATNAFKSPMAAAGIFAAAIVTIGFEAEQAAEKFDNAFRPVQATANLTADQTDALKHSIVDLTGETPRTAESLANVAASLAEVGDTDPREIAADLDTIALAGDALSKTDLKPFVGTLDTLHDAFHLTAQGSREAVVQIAAMTKGRVDFNEFAEVISKGATRLAAFRISATDAAAATVTLIDAGVQNRQATTGLLDILDRASEAEAKAREAAASHKEGDAHALTLFAQTVTASNIESKGFVGTLGELYEKLNGSREQFRQAGLSVADFDIAQKAANASSSGASTQALSYRDALQELTKAAEVNRGSAAALSQILKNDLSAALIDLGNTFLPKVLIVLQSMVDMFGGAQRGARDFRDELAKIPGLEKLRQQTTVGQPFDENDPTHALNNIVEKNSKRIQDNPAILDDKSVQDLIALQQQFARVFQEAGGIVKGSPIYDSLQKINKAIVAQTGALDQATIAKHKTAEADAAAADSAAAFANTGAKAAAAADQFSALVRATDDYADSLGDVKDPLRTVNDRIAVFSQKADEYIASLTGLKAAAATELRDTILDKLAFGAEKLAAVNIKKINEDIDALIAGLSTNASDAITEQYRKKIQGIKDEAATARASAAQATNPVDQQTFAAQAAVLDALAAKYDKQGAALADLADKQDRYNRAIQTVTEAQKAGDAAFTGSVPKIEAVRAANAVLVEAELELKKRVDDTTLSLDEHTKAVAKLAEVQAALHGTPLPVLTKPAQDANVLASGLILAANSAAELSQNLGESGGNLGRLASAGLRLAAILKTIQVSQKLGDDGKSQAVANLSSKNDFISLIVGGVVELASALDVFGTKAKERANEMREAARVFNLALSDFAITDRTDLEDKIRANLKAADTLAEQAGKAVGFATKGPGTLFQSKGSADIQKEIDSLRGAAAAAYEHGTKASKSLSVSLSAFADNLQLIADDTLANERKLEAAHVIEVARNNENLNVRALIASGRADDAAALRLQYEQERELTEAKKDGTDAGIAYVAHLEAIQEAEKAAAETARTQANAQRILDDEIKAFGLSGAEALSAIVKSLSGQFSDIADAVAGLDLSTQAGLDTLLQRGQDLFAKFSADGNISDDEQKILDSLFKIYDTASDLFDSLAEKVQRALGRAATDNSVLGGDARTQFGRTTKEATGFSAVLDGIIGSLDLSSAAGADAAKAKLKAFYVSIASDGIDASKQPIVDLIQSLLGGIGAVWDEEMAKLDAQVKARSDKRSNSSRYNAVNDKEGADAFINDLSALPAAISNMFGEFNVRTAEGVAGAKKRLREFNDSITGLTEAEVLAKFGVTRDEITGIISDLDGGLDSLASGFDAVASSALDAKNALADFVDSIDDEFLRATGKDRDADIAQAKQQTAEKLAKGKELGVSQAELDKIVATGDLKIKEINKRYDDQAAADVPKAATPSTAAAADAAQANFVSSAVTSISSAQALRITDYLASSLIVQRDTLGLLRQVFGVGVSAVRVPSLPVGFGTGANTQSASTGGNTYITIQVAGNLSTREGARELSRTLAPLITQEQVRMRASGSTS